MNRFSGRVVASHGLGNQFSQLAFAHYLRSFSGNDITFENNPLFSKGMMYMLKDIEELCPHLNFRNNSTISHEQLIGRFIMKSRMSGLIKNLIMQNFYFDKKYFKEADEIFDFYPVNSFLDTHKVQFFGFFMNWRYIYSERHTVIPEILQLVNYKCENQAKEISTKKSLVIHVRRGDYLVRGNDKSFGIIDPGSYEPVIVDLIKSCANLKITTVTDDVNLAKNPAYNKHFGNILDKSMVNEWEALNLMINADYLITANSTFSWWGAILAYVNKGTLCFIPKKFYRGIDDKQSFLYPGLATYDNSFL